MQQVFTAFARQNAASNKAVLEIVGKLTTADQTKDRGSYYGSLLGMVRHILGGEQLFLGMFKGFLAHNNGVSATLAGFDGVPNTDDLDFAHAAAELTKADRAFVSLIETLSSTDLLTPVALPWYNGKTVPFYFALQQMINHGQHHRGQISQVLDELKIDNNYSGLALDALSA